jgi:hypothetical protein
MIDAITGIYNYHIRLFDFRRTSWLSLFTTNRLFARLVPPSAQFKSVDLDIGPETFHLIYRLAIAPFVPLFYLQTFVANGIFNFNGSQDEIIIVFGIYCCIRGGARYPSV